MALGRMPRGQGLGPGGNCVCPVCGYSTTHATGQPCYNIQCPKCSSELKRE